MLGIVGKYAAKAGLQFQPDGEIAGRLIHGSRGRFGRAVETTINAIERALAESSGALTGLMPQGNADVLDRLLTVDASDGERLAERMRRSLSVTAMPAYLNCCRLQAEALVRHGVVTRIGEDRNNRQFGLNMRAVEDLDEFLARFRSAGTGASALTAGMADVVEASRILRWPAIDIIKLVLGGRLKRVALLSADLKLKSVLVDTEEVRERLREGDGEGRLSVVEAAERLQLEP
ncbi:hypothetical protein A9O63_02740 [Cereibacter johrii]|nr:hypothetical protein A9O63_02740 [Cereibacter johrii]